MGGILQWLLTLRVLNPVIKPVVRLIVGLIAIPIFRLCVRRMVRDEKLDQELSKDLEQWFRGSLMLLIATANMESFLFGDLSRLDPDYAWLPLAMRVLLAVGVIEAMPDQALFAIIYPGPPKFLFPKGGRVQALREQAWPMIKGMICRHIDRSSSVFAIIAAIKTGWVGWICYGLAVTQFLIIGLMCSKEKAIDVLSKFDEQIVRRRQELQHELEEAEADAEPVTAPAGADLRSV